MVGAGAYYFHSRRAPVLTEQDTVVVANFTNTTGDTVFDGTLRQGLSAQLEQSPFLNLLSDTRIAQTLALMAQPKDASLTGELARQICERTASAATIQGSIARLGTQYVLGLQAVNCHSGDLLAAEQVTADGKEQVLHALGEAATAMRKRLGESLATIQKYDVPPENVTTPSLEALQAYSLGTRAIDVTNDFAAAISLFKRAAGLDPHFAMAYLRLGESYYPLGEFNRAAESARQAYQLRERASEHEKLAISCDYEVIVTGNLDAARRANEILAQTYPHDEWSQINLWLVYVGLGDYARALTAARKALQMNSGSSNNYVSLVYAYQWVDSLDKAKAAAQEAHAGNLDSPWFPLVLYVVNFLKHDTAEMGREAASLMGKQNLEDQILFLESETAAYRGEFAKSRELTIRAAGSAQRADQKETAAEYQAHASVREALVGNVALAKQQAQAALALANGKHVEGFSAIALGLADDSATGEGLAGELGKRFPQDTVVQFDYLPMIHAAIALRSGNAGRAIAALAAARYELGHTNSTFTFGLYPVYLRGLVYLAARQGAAAAVEFQKILDHAGVVGNEPIGALAYLGLGRAHALAGDRAKAKSAYRDFLSFWKDADPDIPILKQAKAEYAKLQ